MIKKDGSFISDLTQNKTLYLMISPTILFFIIFSYLPMVGIYYAFTNFNFTGGLFGSPFVGLDNFEFLFKTGTIITVTKNTILYNIVFLITGNFSQILAAILLCEIGNRFFKRITQTVMLLPWFVSFVLIGAFMYALLNFETGTVNGILKSFGIEPFDAYGTTWIWKWILYALNLWKWLGYGTVIYLAAVMSIGTEFYESADIDGANSFQKIWHITLPLLKPTLIIMLLLSLGNIMKGQFDLFYQIIGNNGMLFEATDIIDTFVFRSLKNGTAATIGMGTAAGLYQSFIGFILVMSVNYFIRKTHEEYALF